MKERKNVPAGLFIFLGFWVVMCLLGIWKAVELIINLF